MKKALSYLVLFLLASTMAVAQNFPVQSNVNITPPYSVYLSDYASISSDKLLVTLMLKDVNQADIQVKLRLTIKGNGIEIRTRADYQPQPLLLQGGAPLLISGTELEGYLNPDNLDVSGISKSQFAKNKKLPEGVYQFMAEAVEYRRNVTISNQGMTVGWLVLNDPPRWTLPMTNSLLTATYPQNIFFSWMPMSTASPNAAFTTEYEFTIVELWPEGRAPGDAINSSIPIYQTTTSNTSLVYGPAEPELVPGRKYVCRLRAYDTEGRDLFKNKGYSEILVFTYGQACKPPNTFTHQVLGPEDARINWTSLPGNTQFTLSYAEQNADGTWSNWYNNETMVPFSAIKGLKPAHTYRYQLKAICGTLESEYSETKQFSTPAPDTNKVECGKDISIPKVDDSPPLPVLKVGDIINVGGFEARIIEVEGSGGSFSGKCVVNVKTFGGVRILSEFENISVNESHQVTAGVINSVKGELNIIGLDGILDSLGITGNNDVVDNGGGNGDPNVGDPYEDGDSVLVVLGGEEIIITGDTTIITASGDTIVTDFSQIPPIIVVNGDATDITTDKLDYDHVDDGSGNDVATNVTDTATYAIKLVKFRPVKKQLFGFDQYPEDIPQFWADYHKERVNKKEYPISWKSNQSLGLPDNVIMDITTDNPDSIKTRLTVESSVVGKLGYSFNTEDSTWVIMLNGQSNENEDRITAYYTQDDGSKIAVGFMDMVSYNEQKVKLVIVPVGDKYGFDKNPNYTELKDSLNAIYKGAITFWDVSITDPLVVDYEDNDTKGLDTELPDIAAYTKEMRNLRNALKDRSDYNSDAYYLFLVDKSEKGNKNGIMPFRRHFGFIFMDNDGKLKDNKEKLFHTIAHELGHGAFGLEHVWQEKGTSQGGTYNLMDYTSKKPNNLLRKYQWYFIHNPKSSWFGGSEEETSQDNLKNNHPKDPAYYMNDPNFAGFTYEERLSAYMRWHFEYDIDYYLNLQFGYANKDKKELYKEQILNPNEAILIKGGEYQAVEEITIKMALLNFKKHIDYWDRHKNDVYITYDEADWANEQVATRNRLAKIRFEMNQVITINDIVSLIFDGAGAVVGTIILFTPNGFNYFGLMAALVSSDNFIKDIKVIRDKLNKNYTGDVSTYGGRLMGEELYSYVGIAVNISSGIKGAQRLLKSTGDLRDKATFIINSSQNINTAYGVIKY